jgi:hypothetical protein
MLAERPSSDVLHDEPPVAHDRSMLVLQYLMAAAALVAALLLAGVR